MNSRFTDVLLGLLFFGALIGLGVVTIGVSDLRILGMGPEHYDVEIYSPDVGYLRPGDPILLHGMPAGKVLGISRMADPVNHILSDGRNVPLTIQIDARMDIDPYDILGVDHRIYIEDRGMLGGRLLRIEAGDAQPAYERGAILVALSSQSLWQTGTEVVAENRASIRSILDDLADFTGRVRRGEGLLGAVIYDDGLVTSWRETTDNLREGSDNLKASSERIERGEGLLGRLLQDDSLYLDAQGVVDNAEQIATDLQTVSNRLLDVSGRLERGEGTLGRLLSEDSEVYAQIETIVDDIEGFTSKLNAGGGVLGTLVSDEELADDLRDIIAQMRGLIEDARETSPVADVGSFLFGTF